MSCGCDIDLKLCLPVGTSPIWGFTVTDPDNSGAAVDITSAAFEMFVKAAASDADADAIYSLSSADDEIVVTNAAAGTAQIINDTAKSALLTAGKYYYWSLRITFGSGEVRLIRNGKLHADYA